MRCHRTAASWALFLHLKELQVFQPPDKWRSLALRISLTILGSLDIGSASLAKALWLLSMEGVLGRLWAFYSVLEHFCLRDWWTRLLYLLYVFRRAQVQGDHWRNFRLICLYQLVHNSRLSRFDAWSTSFNHAHRFLSQMQSVRLEWW